MSPSIVLDPPAFPWQQLAKEKRLEIRDRIPKAWRITDLPTSLRVVDLTPTFGIMTAKELEIVEEVEVDVLLERMATGTWSAEEVVTAYCKSSAIAQQLTNCLSEFWFEEAIARAKELDEIRKVSGPVGPLHGLPISLKDQFQIKGKECNMCWASWLGNISTESSYLVESLVAAGAVIHTRTGMAQGAWMSEGDNNVYGRTDNPYNRDVVSGGSSSGEGVIGAMGGSPIGFGTDIGGSIRIPASFNNLFGLRPTSRRLPYGRALNTLMGQESVESVLGPMSRSLSGVVVAMQAILESRSWEIDPMVVPMPWNADEFELKHKAGTALSIAVYDFDGIVQIQPPVRRAMEETVAALKAAGHQILPWKPTNYAEAEDMLGQIFDADGGDDLADVVAKTGEPLLPGIVVGKRAGMTVFESYQLNRKKVAFREKTLARWNATSTETRTGRPIDAILCPCAPYAPPPHGKTMYFGYTGVYNLLDWPAIAFPVTFVDPLLDPVSSTFKPISDLDRRCMELYDPAALAGLPIGLQLVGRRFREEELLGMTGVVMQALGKWVAKWGGEDPGKGGKGDGI